MDARPLGDIIASSHERLTVVLNDRQATMLVLRLPPGEVLPRRRHVRSDVILQIVSGTARIAGFTDTSAAAPEALFVPCGKSYSLQNPAPEELVLLVLVSPGVTTLESKPYGAARCPLCSAELAVEEGDLPGDRVICPDCTVWMRIVEAERGYTTELA